MSRSPRRRHGRNALRQSLELVAMAAFTLAAIPTVACLGFLIAASANAIGAH